VVNLQKTKKLREWKDPSRPGHTIAQIREGKRGTQYFCLAVALAGAEFTTLRAVKDLRVCVLKDAAVYVATLSEEHNMYEGWLETLLDFIYLELNRRLNKE
jgi:hypothetical protein